MDVLLDTCALLWATCDELRLADEARELVRSPANSFVLSSISIWEIALKQKRGLITMGCSPTALLGRLRALDNMRIIDVSPEIWLESVALDWEHRDPADRAIVATAARLGLPILTRDQCILDFYPDAMPA